MPGRLSLTVARLEVCRWYTAIMATKNKKKKSTRLVRSTRNKVARSKKTSKRKTSAKSAKRKVAKKKAPAKRKAYAKSTAKVKPTPPGTAEKDLGVDRMVASSRRGQALSGRQAGDLQGLSDVERADSESIEELLEDGDAFEAGVVQGVEEAEAAETSEVRIREVPEDDVPQEYLEED